MNECLVDDCARPVYARRMCDTHRRHVARYGEPRPIRAITPHGDSTVRNDAGQKRCVRCNEWRDESEFYSLNQTRDKLNSHCKPCMKWNNLLRIFGLTPEQYEEILAAQGGGCAICKKPPTEDDARRFPVDHDRTCCPGDKSCGNCIRGILCPGCNTGLGMFRDDPVAIERAIAYLEASQ